MRAICKKCKANNTCIHLEECEPCCPAVEYYDIGYEEAVLKAVAFLETELNGDNIEGCKDSNKLIEDFKKAMET